MRLPILLPGHPPKCAILSTTMSFNRTAYHMAPLLLRSGSRTAFARSSAIHRQLPAMALLVPRRALSGDTSSSSNQQPSYPPPGFNAEQAKKPLSKDTSEQSKSSNQQSQASSGGLSVNVPADKPTEHAPTKAQEQRALNELAAEKVAEDKAEEKKLATKKEEDKKLTIRQKIMKELHHYWDGTKLLATEVRISTKLALKMAAGYELTRREHRQVSLDNSSTCTLSRNLC